MKKYQQQQMRKKAAKKRLASKIALIADKNDSDR